MALASIDDYEQITGETVDPGDQTRIERLLEIASASLLASAHGQLVAEDTTTATLVPSGGVVRLPQRPVSSVAAVVFEGVTLSAGEYRWTEGGEGQPAYLIRRIADADSYWTAPVTVTYTHGWAEIPEPLIAATVMLVQQVKLDIVHGGRTVQSEAVDDYSVRFFERNGLPAWVATAVDQLTAVSGPTSIPIVRDR